MRTARTYIHEYEKAQRSDHVRNKLAELYEPVEAQPAREVVPLTT